MEYKDGGFMEPELKPCPFCGGKAVINPIDTGVFDDEYRASVGCMSCTCEINCDDPNPEEAERQAVKEWNTRVYPKTVTVKPPAHCGDLSDI